MPRPCGDQRGGSGTWPRSRSPRPTLISTWSLSRRAASIERSRYDTALPKWTGGRPSPLAPDPGSGTKALPGHAVEDHAGSRAARSGRDEEGAYAESPQPPGHGLSLSMEVSGSARGRAQHPRRRVLVEASDVAQAYAYWRLLDNEGYEVSWCPGPRGPSPRRCPLVACGRCGARPSAPMWWCRRSNSIASPLATSLRPSGACIRTHQWSYRLPSRCWHSGHRCSRGTGSPCRYLQTNERCSTRSSSPSPNPWESHLTASTLIFCQTQLTS